MIQVMNIRQTKLPNGIRLITAPIKEVNSATILILFKVGSRYETEKNNGISHFIEHLFFKGTKKRPTTLILTKELDNLGAEYNAFTAKDHTGFYIKINSAKIETAVELISDMLLNSLFDQAEIDKERQVIIEEINMYEDNPLFYVEDLFEKICYQNSPLARLISGPKANIEKITRAAIIKYKTDFYQPKNLVIGLAGKINETKVKCLIKKYFNFSKKTNKSNPRLLNFSDKQNAPRLILKYKEAEQVQVGLGFPGLKNTDQGLLPLYLLGIILGGNMSSRLFIKIREENGLAYFIKSAVNTYEDTGNLYIQAGLTKERIEEAINLILSELKKVINQGITPEELSRAKEFLKGKLILKLEDPQSLIQWLGEQWLLTKKIETLDDKLKKIARVKISDINNIARKIINYKKLNLAVIGPFKEQKIFKKLLNLK